MRLLFLAPGDSIHTIKWVNAMKRKGNEVCLVSLAEHKVVEPIEPGVIVRYLAISGGKGYYANSFALRKIEKEFAPNIINVHYASGYGTLMRVSRLPSNKCILSVWGDDVYGFPYRNKITFYIIRRNLEYVSYIASTSHCMKEQVRRLLKTGKEIVVTPFGVDTSLFFKKTSKESTKFVFGCMKSLEFQYGMDVLIKAFAEFVHELDKMAQENVYLKLYGKGSLLNELQLLAETLGVSKQVEFCGYINNALVPDALNEIDVLCLTSVIDSESFGVAAVEAMACQVPVIASDVDGYKEVVIHEKTGLIVPRNSVSATCMAMKRLYEDEELRKQFGVYGRQLVSEKYEWEYCVQIMNDLYHKVYGDKY